MQNGNVFLIWREEGGLTWETFGSAVTIVNWSLNIPLMFGDFNGTPISYEMVEEYLFAPDNSPGDGTVAGMVPTPPPPFELEPYEAEEAYENLRPPVNPTDVARVKRRLDF